MTDLFTTPAAPPVKKRSFEEVWEEYRAKRNAILRELYPNDPDLFKNLNAK